MQTIVVGICLIVHGLVHLLYVAQSTRRFELRPGLAWPDGSWLFSRLLGLGDILSRQIAVFSLALAALGFVIGGLGLFALQEWWRPVTMTAIALSTAIFLFFWDGKFLALDDKGGVGILISLALLVVVLTLK